MNPKTLQYLMGHSDISVTMNTYTHLGFDDAKDEMIRLEELEAAKKEVEGYIEAAKSAKGESAMGFLNRAECALRSCERRYICRN